MVRAGSWLVLNSGSLKFQQFRFQYGGCLATGDRPQEPSEKKEEVQGVGLSHGSTVYVFQDDSELCTL